MNYFIYKGINSNTFNSLVVQELPAITKPPIKYQTTTIDGSCVINNFPAVVEKL